jgi:hypothetical protein
MTLAVTLGAQHTTVEERSVGAITDVVKFQPMLIAALLAPVLGPEHCTRPHHRTKLTPSHFTIRNS